jgi:outer membrane murein-binding lipoprotein Lpp
MNKFLVAGIVALSVLVFVFGKFQYNQKLTNISTSAQQLIADQEDLFEEEVEDEEAVEDIDDEEASDADEQEDENSEINLEALLEDIPPSLAEKIETNLTANESITILAFGSQSLTDSQDEGLDPWPKLFMEEINKAYSTDLFSVETMSVGEMTSFDMIREDIHLDVAANNADIFLIEPLIWNDNGEVGIDHSMEYLSMLMNSIKTENKHAVAIVHPSHPVYNTNNYPLQIEELRSFSNENDYLYIDHWSDWPDVTDEELNEYVNGDSPRIPTQRGHQLWSESVLSMFVN